MTPVHLPVHRELFRFTRQNVETDFVLVSEKVPHGTECQVTRNGSHGTKCRVTRNGSHGTECRVTRNGLVPPIATDERRK